MFEINKGVFVFFKFVYYLEMLYLCILAVAFAFFWIRSLVSPIFPHRGPNITRRKPVTQGSITTQTMGDHKIYF